MALVSLTGEPFIPIGLGVNLVTSTPPASTSSQPVDAAAEAIISIGHIVTSDGASHTINTTGSSSLGWRAETCVFADGATTFKVGLAAVDTANGPPVRAVNSTNVITFDVSKTMVGGGGGVVTTAWQTHVPDTGTKTIANGDLVAFCIQMTARGGSDSIVQAFITSGEYTRPSVTSFTGGSYTALTNGLPNVIITFADGAIGSFYAGEVYNTVSNRLFSASTEYGQLFNLPFAMKIYGLYGWIATAANFNDLGLVLYSAPLSGSPVAEKTISVDSNTVVNFGRKFVGLFASPYTYAANTDIAAVFKPTNNLTVYYKTIASAGHRVADPFGTSSYGVTRTSGAFANINSSLEHIYIGLLAGAFDAGGGGGGGFSGFVG